MMEHAIYSVISPEGCASILWRDGGQAEEAAEARKPTADDLLGCGVGDAVIAEPLGAAHRRPDDAIHAVGDAIQAAIGEFAGVDPDTLRTHRREKFLTMGNAGPA